MQQDQPSESSSLLKRYTSYFEENSDDSDLFSFLDANPNACPREIADLVLSDQQLQSRQGRVTPCEDYLDRLPVIREDEALTVELIGAEFSILSSLGREPQIDSFVERFPELREQLVESLRERDLDTIKPASDEMYREVTDKTVHMKTGPSGALPAAMRLRSIPERIGRYRIQSKLGHGGFGCVYLAYDDDLQRPVAIKVPHAHRVAAPEDIEAYFSEARILASLDHPRIVPVHDVGRTEDGLCYIVWKYVEGTDLSRRLKESPLSQAESVEILASVAEALDYAHKRGLVHRDIKPANILIDDEGQPVLIDFGLALKDEDYGKEPMFLVGTPSYMSPEQASGEGHLVDGRSDVFSLAVVLFEMLTGLRPFRGGSVTELFQKITTTEIQSLRRLNSSIPKELERICLRALSKRASDRYSTAQEFADELRAVLDQLRARGSAPATGASADDTESISIAKPMQIVPRGLRSYDANDADFFLELLPGVRGRDGLPESIGFWKSRVEETDPTKTFRVGLIYGPSGCGKSSLVNAGLFPRLAEDILTVSIESAPDSTELRLLNTLRQRCPDLPMESSLPEAVAMLRRGRALPAKRKILIVIDQFEQWLYANSEYRATDLVRALRQCDGEHVQCILMVRDDFWLAVSRLMAELEIDLVPGENTALLDLFDKVHARRVLQALGVAYDRLPANLSQMSRQQDQFLDRAIDALAENGKVICIRLAVFAEMVKNKPWTPSTLRALGGIEGVGVTFLEETFSSPNAQQEYRFHQAGARAVLAALLPQQRSNIKGYHRQHGELLEVSGCKDRPDEFRKLIRILDSELRLITPTDPGGNEIDGNLSGSLATREIHYQLTHDFLVPSLHEWLTRKQKETVRGRLEMRLEELAELWSAKPENRLLPSLLEWVRFVLLTRRRNWSESQRKMMRTAGRLRGLRASVLLIALALLGCGVFELVGRMRAAAFVRQLKTAETIQVPAIIDEFSFHRRWARSRLEAMYAAASPGSREKLHSSLALLQDDPAKVGHLSGRLLKSDLITSSVILGALFNYRAELSKSLWKYFDDLEETDTVKLRAALSLASFDPPRDVAAESRWNEQAATIVELLVETAKETENAEEFQRLVEAFRPARIVFLKPLSDIFVEESPDRRDAATSFLEAYTSDQPGLLCELIKNSDRSQFKQLFSLVEAHRDDAVASMDQELQRPLESDDEVEKEFLANRLANAAIVLLRFSQPSDKIWQLLRLTPDPRVRSQLIHRAQSFSVDPHLLISRLDVESDPSTVRALLQAIGEYDDPKLTPGERGAVVERLWSMYLGDSSSDHAVAEWLLRKWGFGEEIWTRHQKLSDLGRSDNKNWYVDGEKHTMVTIDGRADPAVGHRFAIADKEVTVAQIRRFDARKYVQPMVSPTDDCPANVVTWFQALAYCQWLNVQHEVPPSEWCFPPVEAVPTDAEARGIEFQADLTRTGYRLPTYAEWRLAFLGGSQTEFFFGQTRELLPSYGWSVSNSDARAWPGGMLKPNPFGLFDMYGNIWEWCIDPPDANGNVVRAGQAYSSDPKFFHADLPRRVYPMVRYNIHGMRVVRTIRSGGGESP